MIMAKNKQSNIDLNEVQKRRDDYVEACNKAKKGKIVALSMLGVTIVCLLVLLIVSLKLNGTGLTVVGNQNTAATTTVSAEQNPTE